MQLRQRKDPCQSKFRSGKAPPCLSKFFADPDFNISLTKIAKILTLINYYLLFLFLSLSCSRNEAKALNKQVMYLFILVFFLGCWFPISLYAMILNSESDGDTVKETLTKFFIGSSLWILLVVIFATLII